MADEPDPDEGGALLSRISNEMVRAQKTYFGRGPLSAKSYMFDDMLFVVMRGGMTVAEQTMLEFGEADMVRSFRQAFENRMKGRLTSTVEELTGRKVLTYQSQILFDPEILIEAFVFDAPASEPARAATAEGQLSEGEQGEADADGLESEASSGQG